MTMEKPNGTVIKTIVRVLENAFVGNRHMDLKVTFTVIRVYHRFLFWKWTDYEIMRSIPYISSPFYDGEYSTNRRLSAMAEMMEQEAKMAILQDGDESATYNANRRKNG